MFKKIAAWLGLIFNVSSGLAIATLLADVTGYLSVFPWGGTGLVSAETALMLAGGMNVANIILRFITAWAVRNG
jgi:hypothetical protein